MGYLSNNSYIKSFSNFLKPPVKKPVNPLDNSPLVEKNLQQPFVQANNPPVIPTSKSGTQPPAGWDATTYANFKKANPNLEPNAEDTARMKGTFKESGALTSQYNPVEQPKLGGNDFMSYYEKLTGVDKLKEAEAAKVASKATAEKSYQESQTAKGTLIQQSQDMFDKFFNSPEITANKEDRAKAFSNLQRIDAEEAKTLEQFRADSQIKGTPSWAYSRQQTIISGGYNAQRAGFAVDYAIANDKLTEAKDYATQAYNHGLTVLQAKMGLVEDSLKHATDLSTQDKADYQAILEKAKVIYDAKKKDQETAVATYVSLASKGVTGINPSMSIEEMTKIAGPTLVKQAQLEASKTSAEIAKTAAETAKIKGETVTPGATGTAAQSQLLSNSQLASDVLKNAGAISGPIQSGIIPFTAGSETANKYKQLKGILALANRQQLKGSGQISDFESRTLESAASSLGRNLSESAFKDELVKVQGVFKTAAGLKTPVMITNPSTGEFTVVESDRKGIDTAIADGMDVKYQ